MRCEITIEGDMVVTAVDEDLQNPGSIVNPMQFFAEQRNGSYSCRIEIDYAPENPDAGLTTALSERFDIVKGPKTPNSGGHTGGNPKPSSRRRNNTLMWAIPVALVVLALFLGLGVMVYKYRRLQHSFLAFAARGNYTRQEDDLDDDDNMVVGFHAG